MKQRYITPAITAVIVRTPYLMTVSPTNEYGNDYGRIRFSSTEVEANDAD
ncbi:MAG: hypothetical protein IKP84_00785 [Prevotella sp.]|nr:hypothetical protein [Prevotella sp.]